MSAYDELSIGEKQDFRLRQAMTRSGSYSLADYLAERSRRVARNSNRGGWSLTGQAALDEWASM